jgi:hypothetical protein
VVRLTPLTGHDVICRGKMNKTMRYILLLTLCTILAACRIDANSILESDESLIVSIHKSSGTTITKKEIKKGDKSYTQLIKWIADNEKGWKPSPATYIPAIEVRGKKFVLNFLRTTAIINFQSPDGNYHQYFKSITEAEYQFLLQ